MAAAPAAASAAASAAGKPPHEDGMDILKFFIVIMAFLTVLVAGMAGYNWSKAAALEEEIEENVIDLDSMKTKAESKQLRDMIAKDRANKETVDVLKKDLGQHLQETVARMGLAFLTVERQGAAGFRQQGFDKTSYKFTLDKVTLEAVTEMLWYLQLSWPGLKIEEMSVQEAMRLKKDDPFPNWKVTVTVSIFRPKEK